mmetsp:Transcript_26726/g.57471  ORF Transcript_26726/g.57471 Transcript_26726/m.57471 type:complete len:222 (+) Transcript_26726:3892-4557(+)
MNEDLFLLRAPFCSGGGPFAALAPTSTKASLLLPFSSVSKLFSGGVDGREPPAALTTVVSKVCGVDAPVLAAVPPQPLAASELSATEYESSTSKVCGSDDFLDLDLENDRDREELRENFLISFSINSAVSVGYLSLYLSMIFCSWTSSLLVMSCFLQMVQMVFLRALKASCSGSIEYLQLAAMITLLPTSYFLGKCSIILCRVVVINSLLLLLINLPRRYL